MKHSQTASNLVRFVGKAALWTCVGIAALAGALWLAFIGLLHVTESNWLEAPPFHESIDVRLKEAHRLTLIDDGAASLAERLRIIKAATKTLELEFFIYELDTSSRVVTQALAAKAKEGVKVRILVDMALPVFRLAPHIAKELTAAGIDVRYYNAASLVRFFRVHHRTHRKLLIADGHAAMLGGRNIADDYFDLSHRYNFLDSDVTVEGPIVKSIKQSFDLYWDSKWALKPDKIDGKAPDAPVSLLTETDEDRATLQLMSQVATDKLPRSTCPDVQFVTDYPGSGVNYRRVFPAIRATLAEARREVLVESPYLVLRPDGLAVVKQLTKRGIDLKILTNTLHSTDAWYTVAPLAPMLQDLAMPNFELRAWKGDPLVGYGHWPVRSGRWGIHGKRAVIDDDIVLLGTYNIDPRSANFNSELMVICRGDTQFADAVRTDWQRRAAQSNVVVQGKHSAGVEQLIGDADRQSFMLMMLGLPLSRLFAFLL